MKNQEISMIRIHLTDSGKTYKIEIHKNSHFDINLYFINS